VLQRCSLLPGSPLTYLTRKGLGPAGLERSASLPSSAATSDAWTIKASAPLTTQLSADQARMRIFSHGRQAPWSAGASADEPTVLQDVCAETSLTAPATKALVDRLCTAVRWLAGKASAPRRIAGRMHFKTRA
jgi:hypothetical protein